MQLVSPVAAGDRVAIGLPTVLDFSGTITRGVTMDFETGRLSILTDLFIAHNSPVSIQFCFAGDFAYMNLSGRVAGVREEDGASSRLFRIEVTFEAAETERAIIQSCIGELAPAGRRISALMQETVRTPDPRTILSLFVTDNPYLLRYRRNGPAEQSWSAILQHQHGNSHNSHQIDRRVNGKVPRFSPHWSWKLLPDSFLVILQILRDWLILALPRRIGRMFAPAITFAFIAHPRDLSDVARKIPLAHFLPSRLVQQWLRYQWPIVGSHITGLKKKNGESATGVMVFSPLTTEQMIKTPHLARKRIHQATRLAEKMGAQIVGLGAYTSILTRDGYDLIEKVGVGLTTGNAFSAAIAVQNAILAAYRTNLSLPHATVAIVGGAGSVGSACAKLLAPVAASLILVDIKKKELQKIIQHLQSSPIPVEGTSSIETVRNADIVIIATNSPHTIITAEHLKSGAIVIDAAQPKNVSESVPRERPDVLVIESAVVKTPSVNCNFDLGVGPDEALGCLSETMLLAANGWNSHYSLGKARPEHAAEMLAISQSLGFRLAYFRNSQGYISEQQLADIARARLITTAHV
jgi:predicted amino acid dehydrogenase